MATQRKSKAVSIPETPPETVESEQLPIAPTPLLTLPGEETSPIPQSSTSVKASTNGHGGTSPVSSAPTVVAVDIGNHKIKLAQGSQVRVVDSLFAEVVHRTQVGELDETSTLVRYLDGDRQDLVGSQWLTGKDAQTYAPDSYQSVVSGQHNRGKIDLGLQLLLGSLMPPLVGTELTIKYLFATLPDVEILGKEFIAALQGRHVVEQISARYQSTFTVHIQQVVLKEEGQGAIAYALSKGICAPGNWHATIDFGGGTTIVQAYNERGQIVPSTRLVQPRGVDDLASAIAADDRFRFHLGKFADPALVLEGIRNGSLHYGGKGFDFSAIFEDQHKLWLPSLAKPAIKKLTSVGDRLKTILLVGGGANLATSLVRENAIVLCQNPDTVNVEGLMILAKIKLSESGEN